MIIDCIGTPIKITDDWPPKDSKARKILTQVSDYNEISIELENCLCIAEVMVGLSTLRQKRNVCHPDLHGLLDISFELSKLPNRTAVADGLLLERSLECSFFVRYARAFISAKGRLSINVSTIEKLLTKELVSHHESLVNTRHDQFGHATSAITRQPVMVFDASSDLENWQLSAGDSLLQSLQYNEEWLDRTKQCIEKIRAHCNERIQAAFEILKVTLTPDDVRRIRDGHWRADPSGEAYDPPKASPRN